MARNEKRKRERERALSNPPNPTLPISRRLRRPLPLAPATPAAAEGVGGGGASSSSAGAPSAAAASSSAGAPSVVIVTGIPGDCTVLELKSRLEIYGPVARTRVDAADGVGYVTFRSAAAADAAVAASLDPARGVAIRSKKVFVVRASDPLQQWKTGVGASPSLSKLLRRETPLSKHGRSNKKLNPNTTIPSEQREPDLSFKGREIVAYDDLF
ncbi:uncharacterized protein At1g27050 [Ananas comosus]|uniref:Uncharacterized protein At1g27050 n=1 Tax=Ananas comosus TaxID=4615 RepID=A0A6P5F1N4_ANACO|nr:uncharacterized protein At1g27050 [Ananas comosus]